MSFDIFRNRFVVFGGRDAGNAYLADTWEYDGTTWSQITTATAPPARWLSEMAFDWTIGQSVMFGGRSSTAQPLDDTWLWDGTTWTQATPTTIPPARRQPTLAFDTDRQILVMFGGTGNGGRLNDTWEWDGAEWTQIITPQSPSGRDTRMAYDSSRQRMVIFAGDIAPNVYSNDTWEYDGTTWTQVITATTPSLRVGNTLDFDVARHRIVMYGGIAQNFQDLSDNWEYDGTNWLQVNASPNLPARRDFDSTMYNLLTGEVFMWGGRGSGAVTDETWVFQGASTGLFSVYGSSCGSSPTMAGTTPTIGQPFNLTFGGLGSSIGVVVAFGLSDELWNGLPLPFNLAPLGLPACDLRNSAEFLDLTLAAAGTAAYSWTVPNDPSLVNEILFCQGVAIDVLPTLTFQGTTGHGRLTIGN